MTRAQVSLTSLIAAVPGGILVAIMVQTFLNHSEQMVTQMHVLAGVSLVLGVVTVITPVAILVGPGRKSATEEANEAKPEGETGEQSAADVDEDADSIPADEVVAESSDDGEDIVDEVDDAAMDDDLDDFEFDFDEEDDK